jgi:hypothetical protein
MYDRSGRFAAVVLAALIAAFPSAGSAQSAPGGNVSLNFAPPKDWTDSSRLSDRPGYWKDWAMRDGGAVHSIVLSVTRENLRGVAYGTASVEQMKNTAGVTLLESGPATTCGDVPAFTYTYRSDRTPGHPMIIRHVIVDIGPLLGDVSYAHPPDVADRSDALDALSTMCERQIYAPRAPAGWKSGGIRAAGQFGVDAFTAPAGDATLIALAVPAPISMQAVLMAPKVLRADETLVGGGEETCGATRVRRTRYRTGSGSSAKLTETLSGYRHGVSYLYSYARPESTPPDPEAERALTSFCDAGATLATPAAVPPAPRPPG